MLEDYIFEIGQRAYEENNPDVVRFLINEGRARKWVLVVIGILETDCTPEKIAWLLSIWPALPWIELIAYMLNYSIDNFDSVWPRSLVSLVPIEQVFCAQVHIPLIINAYS